MWPFLQGGTSEEARNCIKDLWILLELDADCWLQFLLLVHQGEAGRAEASAILWEVLTRPAEEHKQKQGCFGFFSNKKRLACSRDFKNLSRKVYSMVGAARRAIDRPPDTHQDLKGWSYRKALHTRYPEFLASAVPLNWVLKIGLEFHN